MNKKNIIIVSASAASSAPWQGWQDCASQSAVKSVIIWKSVAICAPTQKRGGTMINLESNNTKTCLLYWCFPCALRKQTECFPRALIELELRSEEPAFHFHPFFHQIKASKCNFCLFSIKDGAFADFHSLLCFFLLFPQSRFFDSLSAECFQCIAMVGQWDAGTAQKNRFVLFLDSASVTIYPPHHLPQGTGFSDNKPLVLLLFCPQCELHLMIYSRCEISPAALE